MTLAWAFAHLAVDLACVATVLSLCKATSAAQAATAILAYDLLAFCLQLPFGALMDRHDRHTHPLRAGLASLALVAAAVVATSVPAAAVALAAVGNACFHDAGGVAVLDESAADARSEATLRRTYRATPSGVFISTGALGVFLGTLLAAGSLPSPLGRVPVAAVALVPLAIAAAALLVQRKHAEADGGLAKAGLTSGATPAPEAEPAAAALPHRQVVAAVALVCTTVALRSYAGAAMAFPWKSGALAWVAIGAVVAGKAAGGAVADRAGLPRAALISLVGAAALFPLSWSVPAAGIAATALFNFTMPVTLVALANLLAPQRGLAFGLASFSLAIGALPALLLPTASSPTLLAALSIVSLAALVAGLALATGRVKAVAHVVEKNDASR